MVLAETQREDERQVDSDEMPRLQQALLNIRKQHKWGGWSRDLLFHWQREEKG